MGKNWEFAVWKWIFAFNIVTSYLNTTDCQPCCAMRISLVLVDLRKANTQEKGLMMWELLELILRLIHQEGSFSCNEFNYSIIPENIYHHVGADIQNKQVLIAPPWKTWVSTIHRVQISSSHQTAPGHKSQCRANCCWAYLLFPILGGLHLVKKKHGYTGYTMLYLHAMHESPLFGQAL